MALTNSKPSTLAWMVLNKKMPPTQRVRNNIGFAGLVLDNEIEGLKELHPLGMSRIKFLLSTQEFKRLMI